MDVGIGWGAMLRALFWCLTALNLFRDFRWKDTANAAVCMCSQELLPEANYPVGLDSGNLLQQNSANWADCGQLRHGDRTFYLDVGMLGWDCRANSCSQVWRLQPPVAHEIKVLLQ